ncbi:MAG: imidazole glycerol phosphate synthase subunit HisF [bacterium]|nr:imidazole glycerol phosphate synthase subunit HisF [bacterium]
MLIPRVIPVLLLQHRGVVKTKKFIDPKYIGDPLNAVRIFNEKEVDELILLDIVATRENSGPDYEFISEVAAECFMPITYGGGIRCCAEIRNILKTGVEKVALNTAAVEVPGLVGEAAGRFGSQSMVVSVDVKKSPIKGTYSCCIRNGSLDVGIHPEQFAREMEMAGAGEILLNSIDRDGTMQGYDYEVIGKVARAVGIPVIACGGAGEMDDFSEVLTTGCTSAAGGSYFLFCGSRDAILITYPDRAELDTISFKTPDSLMKDG